jgi:hypothetical protein
LRRCGTNIVCNIEFRLCARVRAIRAVCYVVAMFMGGSGSMVALVMVRGSRVDSGSGGDIYSGGRGGSAVVVDVQISYRVIIQKAIITNQQ